MKNHLKRIAAPSTWTINRKAKVFACRPNPGAHNLENGLPLGIILRDYLKMASTMDEVKKLLIHNDVLIDSRKVKDHHYSVGLFDTIKIPKLNKSYRVIFDKKGNLVVNEISDAESSLKLCKVLGKKVLAKGKIQLNLHDGKNLLYDNAKVNVGDTLVLTLPDLTVTEVLPLQSGLKIYLMKGKYCGDLGVLKEMKGNEAIYVREGQEFETLKKYLFVVGKDKSLITIKH